jgi:hypothetical protein
MRGCIIRYFPPLRQVAQPPERGALELELVRRRGALSQSFLHPA